MREFKLTFMCTAIRNGDKSDFDFVYSQVDRSDKEMRDVFSRALSCAVDRSLLAKYLYKTREFSNNEQIAALKYLALNSNGYDLAWTEMKREWRSLYQK
jgi:hypothetical protein